MELTEKCTAKSKQSGKRCGRYPVPGSNVCVMHGGAAPQVQNAAKLRMIAAADSAAGTLIKIFSDGKQPAAARISASVAVLDRAGYKPTDKLELTGKDGGPIESLSVDVAKLAELPPEQLAAIKAAHRVLKGGE